MKCNLSVQLPPFYRTGPRERATDDECSRNLPVSAVVARSLSPSGFSLDIRAYATTSESAVSCCGFVVYRAARLTTSLKPTASIRNHVFCFVHGAFD